MKESIRTRLTAVSEASRPALYLKLTKPDVSFLVVITAVAGYALGTVGPLDWPRMAHTVFGTTLIAAGASALNRYFERDADALMRRPMSRPLPSGQLNPRAAFWFGASLIGLGTIYLDEATNSLDALLGALTSAAYLFAYTPLKRKTTLATTIGAFPGAAPPLIGWATARGALSLDAWIYYLNELTVPVRALMKEGYDITFANPKGNTPQLDVNSAIAQFFGGDEARLQDYLKFRDTLTGLKNPTRIPDVIASGLDQYDAVFVPGGHGPMIDLLDDPDAGTVMRHFHETSKPTAVLCHGPISLLSALPNSKEVVGALAAGDASGARAKAQGWIYSGYKMTIFSTAEEQQREPLEIGGKVLFYPDFALLTAGGVVSVVAPWKSYVLQDRELISGQNPFSDEALLKLLLLALDGKNKSVSAV